MHSDFRVILMKNKKVGIPALKIWGLLSNNIKAKVKKFFFIFYFVWGGTRMETELGKGGNIRPILSLHA